MDGHEGNAAPVGVGIAPPLHLASGWHNQAVPAATPAIKPTFTQSPQIGLLVAALARAQGEMVSPRKNREVHVKTRKGFTYTFRYSTLDVINDMIREPLSKAGIAVVSQFLERDGRPGILTRIMFEEQFFGSWLPLVFAKDNDRDSSMQDFGAAGSFCERYNIKALLNIASDEDDDGNSAAGNEAVFEGVDAPAGARHLTDEQRLLFSYERMLKASESVRLDDRMEGVQLLKLWQDKMEKFAVFQTEKPEYWSKLLDRVSAALHRAFGIEYGASFAWAWQAIADVMTAEARDAVNATFHREHVANVQALKKQTPQAYSLLMEHIRYFSSRVDANEAIRAKKEQDAAELALEIAAVEERSKRRPVPTDPDPDGFLVPPPKQLPGPAVQTPNLFQRPIHYLMDHTGDIASDGMSSPFEFAKAYLVQWRATGMGDRGMLYENNVEALAWAQHEPRAVSILDQMDDEAARRSSAVTGILDGDDIPNWDDAPLRTAVAVPVPMKSSGVMDALRYLSAVQDSLAAVCDVPAMQAWLAANEPVYGVSGFPIGTRTKILKEVTARKRMLGIAPGSDGE